MNVREVVALALTREEKMKFTLNGKELASELKNLGRFADNKQRIPILSHVAIDTETGTLRTTDLDNTLVSPLHFDTETGGAICVDAKSLGKMTDGLTDSITFELVNDKLHLKSGNVSATLPTAPIDQFPELPVTTAVAFDLFLPADTFKNMVKATEKAVTKERSRFTLAGTKIVANGSTKFVTTDGHRLCLAEFDEPGNLDVLANQDGLSEVAKLAIGSVGVTQNTDYLFFYTGGHTIISRKCDGTFPNYEMVLPKENDKLVEFDIANLKSLASRAVKVADVRNMAVMFTTEGHIATLTTNDGDCSRSETMEVESTDNLELKFNAKYLAEMLPLHKDGMATLTAQNNNVQVEIFAPFEGVNCRYILMPLRQRKRSHIACKRRETAQTVALVARPERDL